MIGYYRKINEKYIKQFKNRVRDGVNNLVRVTDSMVMKVILKEINRLFSIMSGRLTSRRQIPKKNDFPDSKHYNNLLTNIDIDLDKIYVAQTLIESDVQNVANFNSLEREKGLKNLSRVQRKVYSVYLKSKKNIDGTTIIREDFKDDEIPPDSQGVQVNLNKETLTLEVEDINEVRTVIDNNIVDCFFVDSPLDTYNIYPNNRHLTLGSFWKQKRGFDSHWSLKDSKTKYKYMMVDEPGVSNIGSTQFEAVFTFDQDGGMRVVVEEELGNYFQLHSSFIQVDRANSLHSNFSSIFNIDTAETQETVNPKVRLTIPCNNKTPLSSSFIIDLEPNDGGVLPSIAIDESYVYDVNNRKVKFQAVDINKISNYSKTGRYQLNFNEPLIPSRIDIILFYANSSWAELKEYMMAEYIFEKRKTFELLTSTGDSITTTLIKVAYIFVDAESDIRNEELRANNVMKLTGVEK